eukprot:3792-Heterococcus_DN1.PRE.1
MSYTFPHSDYSAVDSSKRQRRAGETSNYTPLLLYAYCCFAPLLQSLAMCYVRVSDTVQQNCRVCT